MSTGYTSHLNGYEIKSCLDHLDSFKDEFERWSAYDRNDFILEIIDADSGEITTRGYRLSEFTFNPALLNDKETWFSLDIHESEDLFQLVIVQVTVGSIYIDGFPEEHVDEKFITINGKEVFI